MIFSSQYYYVYRAKNVYILQIGTSEKLHLVCVFRNCCFLWVFVSVRLRNNFLCAFFVQHEVSYGRDSPSGMWIAYPDENDQLGHSFIFTTWPKHDKRLCMSNVSYFSSTFFYAMSFMSIFLSSSFLFFYSRTVTPHSCFV